MTYATCAPLLESSGQRVVLKSTHVSARLIDLLSQVTLTQTYVNKESTPVEAVYTFALPLAATMLELRVRLGERENVAVAVEKAQAEERYEEAVIEGDGAFMLEESAPGLYTMNVGNLLPGESAVIMLRYAQVHRFQGDCLRFHLPTTLAPRYGDPLAVGLQAHQVPETVLDSGLRFSLEMILAGALAAGTVESPSHAVVTANEEDSRKLTLRDKTAPMDRDFVLLIRMERLPEAMALAGPDREGQVVLAAFLPRLRNASEPKPLNLKIVVDCSGSMTGDSMTQAREALLRILDSLRPSDLFSITAFGNTYKCLFSRQTAAEGENLELARKFAVGLDANMGGTELFQALHAAFRITSPTGKSADVLLLTDGEVWADEHELQGGVKAGHRIFTVGIGAGVAEAMVRSLAEESGGACELVSPNEEMADKIFRHFQRMRLAPATSTSVIWSQPPLTQSPEELDPLFPGDTMTVFACFDRHVSGSARLQATFEPDGCLEQVAEIRTYSKDEWAALGVAEDVLARLAARERIRRGLSQEDALKTALEYGLLTPCTSLLLVEAGEGDSKGQELPALRKVPHTLAAGWGGAGVVCSMEVESAFIQHPVREKSMCISESRSDFRSRMSPKALDGDRDLHQDEYLGNEPADTLEDSSEYFELDLSDLLDGSFKDMLLHLNGKFTAALQLKDFTPGLDDLQEAGMDAADIAQLRLLVSDGISEKVVTVAVLHVLLLEMEYAGVFSRSLRRLVKASYKTLRPEPLLEEKVRSVLGL